MSTWGSLHLGGGDKGLGVQVLTDPATCLPTVSPPQTSLRLPKPISIGKWREALGLVVNSLTKYLGALRRFGVYRTLYAFCIIDFFKFIYQFSPISRESVKKAKISELLANVLL